MQIAPPNAQIQCNQAPEPIQHSQRSIVDSKHQNTETPCRRDAETPCRRDAVPSHTTVDLECAIRDLPRAQGPLNDLDTRPPAISKPHPRRNVRELAAALLLVVHE